MTYRVTAPLVLARDKEGKVHHVYQNGVINWLPEDQKAHFLDVGLVEEVGADGSADNDDDGSKPKKAAPKADWVEFAVADGYDRDEVEAMSKSDIQALFD